VARSSYRPCRAFAAQLVSVSGAATGLHMPRGGCHGAKDETRDARSAARSRSCGRRCLKWWVCVRHDHRSSCLDLIRASINLHKRLAKKMDCRVEPGNDMLPRSAPLITPALLRHLQQIGEEIGAVAGVRHPGIGHAVGRNESLRIGARSPPPS